ncbi:RagB/SusD family nutrient uptake outer membrane protein [Pedobacter metabolipauper]|uniref:SusD-like starch-binding protein associating with outer membrane n=1 Tax=Pedobacter metabolipauper TaxID=425513 RepID=A0A4R6SXA9_9SPHI|nr:RagB/SusD family nutrient uptake outer membrane protein [Pedobacter metabolipauper]TDQ11154.1 SusD-like starch-binding protein associating with outer membrane [Pedobacter metabolipauper]
MKHIKQLFPAYIFGLLLLFSSCNKWLDVTPKTQVKEEAQFSGKQGFIDALFGIYQNSARQTGYGRNLTYGLLDILAQRYENKSIASTLYAKLSTYQYTDSEVQAVVDAVFTNSYGSIAQTNYVLKNVDNGILDETSRRIVKGESLGMRAFLHFDLIRLFSDIYASGANASTPSIAYLREFTVTSNARVSLGAALDLCEADLKAAEELLSVNQNIDLIPDNQGSTNADLFLQYRQNHLNYWAVKATLARLYQFKGDKVNALKYATEVINSQKFKFVNQSTLIVDPVQVTSDLTFSTEHIFSIYVSDIKLAADDVFKNTVAAGESTDLWSTRTSLNAVYQPTLANHASDIRSTTASKSLWNVVSENIIYTKKYWNENAANVKQRLIPVIKLAEMYYIAAESSATLEDGTRYLNVVRTNRLIPEIPVPASSAALDTEILLEYRKEFYAEGQLWFYYKLKNLATIPNGTATVTMSKAKYIFPLPNTELEFGSSN